MNKAFQYSKELRKRMTKEEKILWGRLRNRKLEGYKFRRQHSILIERLDIEGFYVADFYCCEKKLLLELDGGIHNSLENKRNDISKDQTLIEEGFKILRIKNIEIHLSLEIVLNRIILSLRGL